MWEKVEEKVFIRSSRQQAALEYALEKIKESPVADYIVAVYLYGSCARGEERPDCEEQGYQSLVNRATNGSSDIDLFVELSDAFPMDNGKY